MQSPGFLPSPLNTFGNWLFYDAFEEVALSLTICQEAANTTFSCFILVCFIDNAVATSPGACIVLLLANQFNTDYSNMLSLAMKVGI